MTSLHEFLSGCRDAIVSEWILRIQTSEIAPALPSAELRDHVPLFIDEIVRALRDNAGPSGSTEGADPAALGSSPSAAEHGGQRLRLGFELGAVVREYGALRDVIVEGAAAAGVPLSAREYQVLFSCVITGIAEAVSEYARQRNAELQRQATEHMAFLSHELRNPLYGAKLALEVLTRKGLLPESRSSRALQQGLNQMQELLDRTLQAARIGSGVDLRPERIGLLALLEDIRADALPAAEGREINLHVAVDADVELQADPRLLRSAVANLVYNAIKFTRPLGVVCLSGRRVGGRALIEVEDECGGLPIGAPDKVFLPFVRLDTEKRGFGLGLAIAKQAAEAHGGSIRAVDLPGKGCVFVLELPLALAPDPPADQASSHDLDRGKARAQD